VKYKIWLYCKETKRSKET